MGMKQPKGKALKIGGTVTGPSDVNQYGGIGNAGTKAKDTTTGDAKNSAFPKEKPSGNAKTY